MEKNRMENVRKHVFYKHINIVTKNVGKKREKIFFPETHRFASKKRWKKSSGNVRKHVFYKYTNIVTKKKGGKKRHKFFSRNTSISQAKKMEKNRLDKV